MHWCMQAFILMQLEVTIAVLHHPYIIDMLTLLVFRTIAKLNYLTSVSATEILDRRTEITSYSQCLS